MRYFLLAVILWLYLVLPARAQGPIYLPIIEGNNMLKGSLRLIYPAARYNYVLNPSAETTDNFSVQGGSTVTRVTTYQKYGLYSYEVVTNGNASGMNLTTLALDNSPTWATFRTYNPSGVKLNITIGSKTREALTLEKIDDSWVLMGALFTGAEVSAQTNVRITQTGTGNKTLYIDGVQAEAASDANYSSYIDGTQEGCRWLGAAHASRSQRSGESKAGGIAQDFYQEYGFFVERIIGAGASSQDNMIDSYAQLPGGELNDIKVQSREFVVQGWFLADTEWQLHDNIQRLELALDHKTFASEQPTKLRFYGSKVQKEISVYYKGGLEGDLSAFYERFSTEDDEWKFNEKFREKAAIQFDAPDPAWYEVGESATQLDTNDSATFRVVAGRLLSTGQWSPLGPPGAGGTYTVGVLAIAEDATYLYLGGDFLNFDGIAAADNIVRYNKQTGVYSAIDAGLNGAVHVITIAPNGDVYVGGQFTNASGVAAADYLALLVNGGTTFQAVGTPLTGAAAITSVLALAFDEAGLLIIGGEFTNWNNIAAADNIVSWNGTAYAAIGTGTNGSISAIAIADNNYYYIGGSFTTAGGGAANRVAYWNGSAWVAMGDGFTQQVRAVTIALDGLIYIGGLFPEYGYIATWNGTTFNALGDGLDNDLYEIAIGPDGVVYVSGSFTSAGGITLADRIARWNGYAWGHLDIDLPGTAIAFAIHISKYNIDPVVAQNYQIHLGFDTTGTGTFAGIITANNEGSTPGFPRIIISRSGGTSATIQSIRNERTGLTLLCDYDLLNGETVTIDLYPKNRSESSSFFGPVSIVLPNSNMSKWSLLPGSNQISAFVSESGSPTITGWLLWRDSYKSYN